VATKKKKPAKKLPIRKNVGIAGGHYTMQVNFADQEEVGFKRLITEMWRMYRTRRYSQKEIADKFGYSPGKCAAMLRCDDLVPMRAKKTEAQAVGKLTKVSR